MDPIEIRFTDPEEFIAELRKSTASTEDKIVRVTKKWRQGGLPYRNVFVLATAVVLTGTGHRNVLRLTRYVGDDWGPGFAHREEVVQAAEKVAGAIEAACAELGLEVRAGEFSAPASEKGVG